ncbi:TraB/GumN family protein [Aurantiacibacter gangjinensis]|uniref:Uncharacterized protein n=1 Tax=Aurantiacibacter gangjinensis TaxID=502682 RepID=A0A0G9MQ69_9SPHN|nr:TraB/GumN family protein [Aurantiacibacter gangjinensis]APE28721.1 lipoprotein, putative [Aurantiacibacter gangjinensis]KLE32882.1 hypothetical protein AAW01_02355 [Aurantiacibacter gangjinensis]
MFARIGKAILTLGAAAATAFALPASAQDDTAQVNTYSFTQDYEPSPAIWRLADEDTTIYMFGTIHVLPEGFRWRSPEFDAIVEEAETLVVETSDADSFSMLNAVHPKVNRLTTSSGSISASLSVANQQRWREFIETTGAPFTMVDQMPVLVALLSYALTPVEDGSSFEFGVETVLERAFAEAGKPVESIENFGHVYYQIVREPREPLIADLERQLTQWGGKDAAGLFDPSTDNPTGDEYWSMEHAWARGEVQDDFDLGFGQGAVGEAFHDILIVRRNREWAEWLEERLEQPGTILLAVGAGHFEGSDSVLRFLVDRGIPAERIH